MSLPKDIQEAQAKARFAREQAFIKLCNEQATNRAREAQRSFEYGISQARRQPPPKPPYDPPLPPGDPKGILWPIVLSVLAGMVAAGLVFSWLGHATLGGFVVSAVIGVIAGRIMLAILDNLGAVLLIAVGVAAIVHFSGSGHAPSKPAAPPAAATAP